MLFFFSRAKLGYLNKACESLHCPAFMAKTALRNIRLIFKIGIGSKTQGCFIKFSGFLIFLSLNFLLQAYLPSFIPNIALEQTLWLHLRGQVKVPAPNGSCLVNVEQPFPMSLRMWQPFSWRAHTKIDCFFCQRKRWQAYNLRKRDLREIRV